MRRMSNRSRGTRGARGGRGGRGSSGRTPSRQSNVEEKKSLDDSDIPEERYFLNPDAVSRHLFCPICQEVFNNPFRAQCGHSYCKKCISGWLNNSKTCPVDRLSLTLQSMHHDFILENIIGDYQVACPWRPLGCTHVGPLCNLKGHKEKCTLNPKVMPSVMQEYSKGILERTTSEMQERTMRSIMMGGPSNIATTSTENTSSSSNQTDMLDVIMASIPDTEIADEMAQESVNMTDVSEAARQTDDTTVDITDDEAEHLPSAPEMPSLRMRLYISGSEEERSTLCNFLETTGRTRNTGDEMDAKRRRLK